jgi:hypothetical protein
MTDSTPSQGLHPREIERQVNGPTKAADHLPSGDAWYHRLNRYLAVKITEGVGTMWCAYAFAALALVSLPSVLRSGNVQAIIAWIAQTFLQLVLLSIIIVGQNISQAAADRRAEDTFKDASMTLDKSKEIQAHLLDQDHQIAVLLDEVRALRAAQK